MRETTIIAATILLSFGGAPAHGQGLLRGESYWHQDGGTAARRNACEVEPVRALPELLWSLEPGAVTS
ncbi:MAG: hypothetical protein RL112_2200, partial [Planctomycetota bacterium]